MIMTANVNLTRSAHFVPSRRIACIVLGWTVLCDAVLTALGAVVVEMAVQAQPHCQTNESIAFESKSFLKCIARYMLYINQASCVFVVLDTRILLGEHIESRNVVLI